MPDRGGWGLGPEQERAHPRLDQRERDAIERQRVVFVGEAGDDRLGCVGRRIEQTQHVAGDRAEHLGGHVLLRDRELAAVPAVADLAHHRREHPAVDGRRRAQEHRATDRQLERLRVEVDDRTHDRRAGPRVGVALDRVVAGRLDPRDHLGRLGRGHAVVAQLLEPADRRHVVLAEQAVRGVAPLGHRDAVASLPRAQGRRRYAGHLGDGLDPIFALAAGHGADSSFKPRGTALVKGWSRE